jgi:general secretion pathway protein A
MYEAFYGLKKRPFHITPDPEFLYLSPSHKEALAAIIYGIEEKKGFVTIIGAVGVGKTTVLRSYLERVEKKHTRIVYIFNSKLTFEELLRMIYQELGLIPRTNDIPSMINGLYDMLIEEYKQGNTVVLVVDEAQNMPVDTLESLRMISNLETSKDKLLQIVLLGQPEFEEQLNTHRLRQLKQRLAVRSTILPLTRGESFDYVKSRLSKAGADSRSVFTPAALKPIVKTASGVPRVLNVLCDNALITGFGHGKKQVTRKITQEIIRDFHGKSRPAVFGRWVVAAVVTVVIALGIAATMFWSSRDVLFDKMGSIISSRQAKQQEVAVGDHSTAQSAHPAKQRTAATPSSPAIKAPPAKDSEEQKQFTRIVTEGDTLMRLARQVYGGADASTIKVIQESNPQITNPNMIRKGSTIRFPSKSLNSIDSTNPTSPVTQ